MEGTPEQKGRVVERYIEDFDLSPEDMNGHILDVGAGEANFVRYLRETLGNNNAYAVDKSFEQLFGNTEGAVVGEIEHLPFKDNTFDVVVASNILPLFTSDDVERTKKSIEEMIRVLKPGGKIVANINTPEHALKTMIKDRGHIFRNKEHERRISGSEKILDYLEHLKTTGVDLSIDSEKRTPLLTIIKNDSEQV